MSDKIRTTLVLEEIVFQKLKQEASSNLSEFVNTLLKRELFGTRKEMFGVMKGKLSAKDMIEDEE